MVMQGLLKDTFRYLRHSFSRLFDSERVRSFTYRITLLRSLFLIIFIPSVAKLNIEPC